MTSAKKRYVAYLAVLLGSLVGVFVWSRSIRADFLEYVEHELLDNNDFVLAAVDPESYAPLSFSSQDVDGPAYLHLRQHFMDLGEVMWDEYKIKGVYAMKVRGAEVVFIVDSAREDDPWHSEPGAVYQDPPQALFDVLRDGQARFVGPYTDEYGTYYSSFSAQKNLVGETVAIMGLDMSAADFQLLLNERNRAPIEFGGGLALVLLSFFVLIEYRIALVRRIRAKEEEVDRLKADFVSLAVHQLKTPLTGLKWSVETLASSPGPLSADRSEAIRDIGEITRGLNELVNALLNVTRLESGRIIIEPKPTALDKLAAGVIKELQKNALDKEQEITFAPDAGLPEVSVDPLMIREIYKNLLTNAIKYTRTGGRIEVRIASRGADIVSSVKDNGLGIPEDQKARVFEKFFRAHNIVSLSEDGTGLGLYFVKQIVEVSGGRVWFESEEGKGTTFYFSLPLAGSAPKEGEVRLS